MDSTLPALRALFLDRQAAGVPLVLATVIQTQGSTYRKPGARMLFARDGKYAGLLSGGCLESDLQQQALQAIEERRTRVVEYDARGSDDALWGLGLGCEGAMRILLQPVFVATHYDPLSRLLQEPTPREGLVFATVVSSKDSGWPAGRCWFAGDPTDSPVAREMALHCGAAVTNRTQAIVRLKAGAQIEAFISVMGAQVRLLLLGGGPDALAVVTQAALLGWNVTVVDHRSAYANAARLGAAQRVIHAHPHEIGAHLRIDEFDAVVVMSHHLPTDLGYLRCVAKSSVPYVGLLGPAARRERLRTELGPEVSLLQQRLFGPVGLDIGASTPESIALAIVAEIHAFLRKRRGGPFSATKPATNSATNPD